MTSLKPPVVVSLEMVAAGEEEFRKRCGNALPESKAECEAAAIAIYAAMWNRRTIPTDAGVVVPTRRREEADQLLPFFTPNWEALKDVAERHNGGKSPQQLASRARDLVNRGLIESRWVGHYSKKEYRVAALSPASLQEERS
jgi:hypothetical protein